MADALRHILEPLGLWRFMPAEPGVVPGVGATFTLEVEIKGKNQATVITFEVAQVGYYDIYQDEDIEAQYREFIACIGPELVHNSQTWMCHTCGRPATDSGWMSLYTPTMYKRCMVIISAACEICAPKMHKALPVIEAYHNKRHGAASDKVSSLVAGKFSRPEGMSGALLGSCLNCRKEETAAPEFEISRCSKCQLVRYCSVACQKED
ncbi:hypothetical protein B0H19DRAFT_1121774 [Mycena capillaripes]|nr:hypothetical protein B0H19DRAFT_1121774 [Mycena capillaripes]